MWKGDEVSYRSLHQWVNRNFIKPEKCERCGKKVKLEASNNGKLNRERSQWEFICKPCHLIKDGAVERLAKYRKEHPKFLDVEKLKRRKRAYYLMIKNDPIKYAERLEKARIANKKHYAKNL